MPETKDTVEALKTVACPWRNGLPVNIAVCQKCGYHNGVESIIEHRWNDALKKTEPSVEGEVVKCNYPRVVRVGFVVMGE